MRGFSFAIALAAVALAVAVPSPVRGGEGAEPAGKAKTITVKVGMKYGEALKKLDEMGAADISIAISYLIWEDKTPSFLEYTWYDLPNGMHIGIFGNKAKEEDELAVVELKVANSRKLRFSGKAETWYAIDAIEWSGKRFILHGLRERTRFQDQERQPSHFLYAGMTLDEARKTLNALGIELHQMKPDKTDVAPAGKSRYFCNLPEIVLERPMRIVNLASRRLVLHVDKDKETMFVCLLFIELSGSPMFADSPQTQNVKFEVIDLNNPLGARLKSREKKEE